MIEGHGDDLYRFGRSITSNFSSNVYNRVNHDGLYEYIGKHLADIKNYPEPEPFSLEKLIAEKHGISAENVFATNGATEAIYIIAQTFRDRKSAILTPTFSEYEDACHLHGHKISSFYTLDSIPNDADMVWICNPNNPTGEVRELEKLMTAITKHSDKLFIMDQSYEYFTRKATLSAQEGCRSDNVILLHSMTKNYAVPGLRLGFATANSRLTDELRRHRMPWSVNAIAINAGFYLLRHDEEIPADTDMLLKEAERLSAMLKDTGLAEVWPTDTHYMLVRLRMGKASALKEYLADHFGILIRDASNFHGLDESFFRIAAQTPEENDKLVTAIRKWFDFIQ